MQVPSHPPRPPYLQRISRRELILLRHLQYPHSQDLLGCRQLLIMLLHHKEMLWTLGSESRFAKLFNVLLIDNNPL
jgi:hypothetical protein